MTFYSGQNGRMTIKVGSNYVKLAKVTNWQLNASMTPLRTTSLEDTDNTFTNGLRTTTGSCRLFYYDDTSGSTATNSCSDLIKKLMKAHTSGQPDGVGGAAEAVTFQLQVVDGSTSKQVEVDALLTTASMSMAVGEVLAADVAFQVNGAIKGITL